LGTILSHQQKIMHLQYIDDILLFIKTDPKMVERVKWSLRIFEGISGLTINFAKSEVIPLNLDHQIGIYCANLLNCSIGKLSIKYLGIKLH
jgi:Reverse transcriptase (RNA-dependent DNA polymerase)